MHFNIRTYEDRDRESIRQICCDTALQGKPIDRFFHDREIVAELLTAYYTDFEPASCWVAEYSGRVIGYLTGCRNNRRYASKLTWPLVPRMLGKALSRGLFLKKLTWRLLMTTIKNWQIGSLSKSFPWDQNSGHLHIDVSDQFRGQRVGQRLMEKFVQQATEAGLRGIYAVTYENNLPACRFFEKMGFDVVNRLHRIMPEGDGDRIHQVLVYRKSLKD